MLFILDTASEPSSQARKRFSVIIQKEKNAQRPHFFCLMFLLPSPSVPSTVLRVRNTKFIELNRLPAIHGGIYPQSLTRGKVKH